MKPIKQINWCSHRTKRTNIMTFLSKFAVTEFTHSWFNVATTTLKQNSKTGQKFGPLTSIYHSCFVWQLYKNTLKPYFGSYTKPCSPLQTQYLDSKSTAALEVVISQYLMWQWKIWIMHTVDLLHYQKNLLIRFSMFFTSKCFFFLPLSIESKRLAHFFTFYQSTYQFVEQSSSNRFLL